MNATIIPQISIELYCTRIEYSNKLSSEINMRFFKNPLFTDGTFKYHYFFLQLYFYNVNTKHVGKYKYQTHIVKHL